MAMSGCRSHRRAARERKAALAEAAMSGLDQTLAADKKYDKESKKNQRNTEVNALQANMSMTLKSGNKSIKLTGSFRAKRDDVIQMNLVYTVFILPVNVGTLEITPTDILVLDRMGKRYCRVAYEDVAQFKKYGIDFQYLQNLFWGDGEEISGANISCTYDSWTNLSLGRFPADMTFTVRSRSKSATAVMQLTDIQESDQWNNRTSVGNKYTPVSLDAVMNAIMKIAN